VSRQQISHAGTAVKMFAVIFPEIGDAAFHLSDEILYPVVRRLRSFTRFFPIKRASARRTISERRRRVRRESASIPSSSSDVRRTVSWPGMPFPPFFHPAPCNAILLHLHCIVKHNTAYFFMASVLN
jgi:hypothetical protein